MSDSNQSSCQSPESVLVDATELFEVLDKGTLGDQFCDRVQDMVERVRDTGRKGKVKLELGITLSSANQVEITPSIKTNAPKREYQDSVLWADDQSQLYRRDPDQITMEFERSPEGADAATRESVTKN